eukprot:TRINITY_DN3000_c0_g1_i1.p1 TRINITY_DN3000_c0_g1~~TRINITY_DN3000_c0_g1_i1.p1  ORF type:complete len:120 (-),score=47.26 TRINITY_DN3000_c0_g1_i1:50-409(-)
MIRRPPRSTLSSSSAASDVYKRQVSTQSTGATPPHNMGSDSDHGDKTETPAAVEGGAKQNFNYKPWDDILPCCIYPAVSPWPMCVCHLGPVSYTHLRAHETPEHLVCRLLLEKKKKKKY